MMKKRSANRDGVNSLIGSSSVFTGSIEADGTVRVDGRLIGDMKVTGDVYVGGDAEIKGNIDAENIHLAGTVDGNITARGILKILSSAKLYGDIRVNSFVADEGALFQGKCEMLDASSVDEPAVPSMKSTLKSKRSKKSNVLEEVYEEKKGDDPQE